VSATWPSTRSRGSRRGGGKREGGSGERRGQPEPWARTETDGRGATGPGPRNVVLDRQIPDILTPPHTDHGPVPNPWFPFSAAHNRLAKGGWAREVTARDLPIDTGTAYTNRYRFVPPKKPRTQRRSPNPSFTKQLRPREEWIAIPVPAVIDQQTHDLAAAQLARNATLSFRHNTKRSYLLRCLLRCQSCGLAMCGITHKAGSRHGEVGYYVCSGKDLVYSARTERCRQRRVRMDERDAAVWEHLCTLLRDPAQLLAQFEAFAQRDPAGGEAQAEQLATQVARLAREEQRLIDAYQGEVISLDELRQRRERVQQQREGLERQRAAYARQREQAARAQEVLTDLTAFCARVSSRLAMAPFSE